MEEVQVALDYIQSALEVPLFLNPPEDTVEIAFDPFEVVSVQHDLLVLLDTTGDGWKQLFEGAGVTDETMRKILQSVHMRVGNELVDRPAEQGYVVVSKPEWANYVPSQNQFVLRNERSLSIG
ncbi:hypothetical protein SAMN06264855_1481 [Halorubrum vacuolatum]|uniref:Uncharacterized protein n=1 Tax=Halorubrum vacuolatum TaxID=63740 RepID=A0A238YI43_HALVU|nr:hypothetical protein SAMN06264855_1481 [Halorubrum vacuolatum]